MSLGFDGTEEQPRYFTQGHYIESNYNTILRNYLISYLHYMYIANTLQLPIYFAGDTCYNKNLLCHTAAVLRIKNHFSVRSSLVHL